MTTNDTKKEVPSVLVKDLMSIRGNIEFLYARKADGTYFELTSKANEKLSRKLLIVKKALKGVDGQFDDLREAHIEKDQNGNFKVTEDRKPVYKTKTSAETLSKMLKEIEESSLPVVLGEPIPWELFSDSNVNGSVLTELCLLGVVADPKD